MFPQTFNPFHVKSRLPYQYSVRQAGFYGRHFIVTSIDVTHNLREISKRIILTSAYKANITTILIQVEETKLCSSASLKLVILITETRRQKERPLVSFH